MSFEASVLQSVGVCHLKRQFSNLKTQRTIQFVRSVWPHSFEKGSLRMRWENEIKWHSTTAHSTTAVECHLISFSTTPLDDCQSTTALDDCHLILDDFTRRLPFSFSICVRLSRTKSTALDDCHLILDDFVRLSRRHIENEPFHSRRLHSTTASRSTHSNTYRE